MELPHRHRHYFTTTKTEFEPLDPEEFGEDAYRRAEFAYMMCNSPCNHVKKVPVHKEAHLEDL